jgi:hypothetical protein
MLHACARTGSQPGLHKELIIHGQTAPHHREDACGFLTNDTVEEVGWASAGHRQSDGQTNRQTDRRQQKRGDSPCIGARHPTLGGRNSRDVSSRGSSIDRPPLKTSSLGSLGGKHASQIGGRTDAQGATKDPEVCDGRNLSHSLDVRTHQRDSRTPQQSGHILSQPVTVRNSAEEVAVNSSSGLLRSRTS